MHVYVYAIQRKCVFLGHEGSIVAVSVDGPLLVSSSSDLSIRMWDRLTGVQIRVMYGHAKSVLTLELGNAWLVSGSADGEIRLWTVEQKNKRSVHVTCLHRLLGHECQVTCVRHGELEIVSGDAKGMEYINSVSIVVLVIFIWILVYIYH